MGMQSRVSAEFDAAEAVMLRDITDGAETGADTDAETGVALNQLLNAYWHNDEHPDGVIAMNVLITAIVNDTTTYAIIFEACTAADGTGAVEVARLALTGAEGPGFYRVFVSCANIDKMLATADFIRVKCTKTGAGASITYGVHATYAGIAA